MRGLTSDITGAARLYRAASVWTAGLGLAPYRSKSAGWPLLDNARLLDKQPDYKRADYDNKPQTDNHAHANGGKNKTCDHNKWMHGVVGSAL